MGDISTYRKRGEMSVFCAEFGGDEDGVGRR